MVVAPLGNRRGPDFPDDRLAEWADEHRSDLDGYEPDNPLEDRPADVWEPLLAIGDHAGDLWTARARSAAVSLTNRQDTPESLGIELLRDIRTVWPSGEPTVAAAELVRLLRAVEEMRWVEHRGNGLTARSLNQLLRKHNIYSHKKNTGNVYANSDLVDEWERYLEPPSLPVEPPQPPQGPQGGGSGGNGPLQEREGPRPQVPSNSDYRKEAWSF